MRTERKDQKPKKEKLERGGAEARQEKVRTSPALTLFTPNKAVPHEQLSLRPRFHKNRSGTGFLKMGREQEHRKKNDTRPNLVHQ